MKELEQLKLELELKIRQQKKKNKEKRLLDSREKSKINKKPNP